MRHDLPPAARALAGAVEEAVAAATARDTYRFDAATAALGAVDPEQVRVVLGAVVRLLLEELHPDGLDSDDARVVLSRVVAGGPPWVDARALLVVLAGALGVLDGPGDPAGSGDSDWSEAMDGSGEPGASDDSGTDVSARDVVRHAPLVVADLLAAAGRPLRPYLGAALAEVARAESVELP